MNVPLCCVCVSLHSVVSALTLHVFFPQAMFHREGGGGEWERKVVEKKMGECDSERQRK